MAIFTCRSCGGLLYRPDEMLGTAWQCPTCGPTHVLLQAVNVPEELAKLFEEEYRRLVWSDPSGPEAGPTSASPAQQSVAVPVVRPRRLRIDLNPRMTIQLPKGGRIILSAILLSAGIALFGISLLQPWLHYSDFIVLLAGIGVSLAAATILLYLLCWLWVSVVGRCFGPRFRRALAAHEHAVRQTTENTSASSSIKAGPSQDVEASRDNAPDGSDQKTGSHGGTIA